MIIAKNCQEITLQEMIKKIYYIYAFHIKLPWKQLTYVEDCLCTLLRD
jgi:hypothetical protein